MYRKFKPPIVAAFLLGLVGLILHLTPPGRDFEEDVDLRVLFRLRGQRPVPPDVVIVSLDQESVEKLGLPSNPVKWPRTLYARLTEGLVNSGAAVIVYDIYFGEPTSEDDDRRLAHAFSSAGNVLLCEHLRREVIPVSGVNSASGTLHVERIVPPTRSIADAAAALAPYPLPKVPMVVRQTWRFKTEAGCTPTLPFLAFQLFCLDVYKDFIRLLESVSPQHSGMVPCDAETTRAGRSTGRLAAALRTLFEGNSWIADEMSRRLLGRSGYAENIEKTRRLHALIKAYTEPDSVFLNFYGPPGTITTIPFHRVLNAQSGGKDFPDFKGKVVFVGLSELLSPENRDGFHTVFSKADGVDLSGVEIAATAFANLIENMPVRPAPPAIFLGIILVCGLLLGFACCFLTPVPALAGMVVSILIYGFTANALFTETGLWLPLAIPCAVQAPLALCGGFLRHHAGTQKERVQIRKAFGFFLPDGVIDQIIADMKASRDIAHSHQTVFGTVLCSDGSQYAALSENMKPRELSIFLNKYYEAIFHPVKANKGIVSDIIGDSMLALWTSTTPNSSLKRDACRSALEIMDAIDKFNRNSETYKLHTRIGLHYGEILLGNVGGSGHFEYRPVGDVVNTASRIEGLNKYFGTRILVSKEIMDEVPEFLTRELGKFRVYGKVNPVNILELICPIEHADETQKGFSAIFSQALEAFRERSWDRAERLFLEYLSVAGEDEAARHYLTECAKCREHPPDETWDGMLCCERK
jgi:adenylate cyclase